MKIELNNEQLDNLLRDDFKSLPEIACLYHTDVPADVLEALQKTKEGKFPAWRELAAKEIEPLLLSVLAHGQMDGYSIITSLEKGRIRIKGGGGEAVVYGVISKLVAKRYVQVDLEDRGGQMRKFYRLTDEGHGLLKTVESTALQAMTTAVLSVT